jgi:DNA-binding GntR family transcriptional regulator
MNVAHRSLAPPSGRISLSEHAYLFIRDRILRGDIPLGAAITRRKLAAELGISVVPVAEALQRLEDDGLVESRPRVGTRVCMPTAEDIRERYQVREALESQAARLFAEKASARERQELEDMAAKMDEMFNECFQPPRNSDHEYLYAVHRYHADFHLRIAECTGCRTLRQTIERNHVLIFNWLFDVAAQRPPLPPRFHRELMQAINRGDPEEADRAMRSHIRYGVESNVAAIALRTMPAVLQRRGED